jgi:hypothetical protein
MRALVLTLYILLMSAAILSSATADEILQPTADGWHTWQVDEPGVSSEMCCFTWKRGDNSRKGCNLDGHTIAFSDSGDCAVAPGTIQVYVRLDDGEPKDIRVLSSNCPVSTESEVADHGLISASESLAWFRSIIEDQRLDIDVREEALFGLVQSESDAAFDYIDSLLTQS